MQETSIHFGIVSAPGFAAAEIAPAQSREEIYTRYALHYGVEAIAHARFAAALLTAFESDEGSVQGVLRDFEIGGHPLAFNLAAATEGVELSSGSLEAGRLYLIGDTVASRVEIAATDYINPLALGTRRINDQESGVISPALLQRDWSVQDLHRRERVGALLVLARELWTSCASAVRARCPELDPAEERFLESSSKLVETLCEGRLRGESLDLGVAYMRSLDEASQAARTRELTRSIAALQAAEARQARIEAATVLSETLLPPNPARLGIPIARPQPAPEPSPAEQDNASAGPQKGSEIARLLQAARGVDPSAREEALQEVRMRAKNPPEDSRKEWKAAAKVCKSIATDLAKVKAFGDRLIDCPAEERAEIAQELKLFLMRTRSAGVRSEAQALLRECSYVPPKRELVRRWTVKDESETARDLMLNAWQSGAYVTVWLWDDFCAGGYVLFGAMPSGTFLLIDPDRETSYSLHVDDVVKAHYFEEQV